ncbi:hypothetical protein M407DRAFT_33639 [Tulasnella calospora MUT 4182]|uniref:Uncharacterized protein n=1 Tax=Tulasnella calospora MUT 4182 TaxID=1051891 RepID=A0A0C3Q2P0_9AGAM|nr:hypothetical protein M407DRAFT_33639 [Tulasnella calospora MUT 4182]
MQLNLSIFVAVVMASAKFVLATPTGCSDIYQQCGGSLETWSWTGPTCCINSADPTRELTCHYVDQPSPLVATSTWPLSSPDSSTYVATTIDLAISPWNLLKDFNSFFYYLASHSVFLSSIAVVMISEFWFVRRGHHRVPNNLYHTGRDERYWSTFGINWRAYATYISGILINVVGFAGADELRIWRHIESMSLTWFVKP